MRHCRQKLDFAQADVVSLEPIEQLGEVEVHRLHHAYACNLLFNIDLRVGAVQAPERPEKSRKLFVSGSALEPDFEKGEVVLDGIDPFSRLSAGSEREHSQGKPRSHMRYPTAMKMEKSDTSWTPLAS